jgi:hypothetical protein
MGPISRIGPIYLAKGRMSETPDTIPAMNANSIKMIIASVLMIAIPRSKTV